MNMFVIQVILAIALSLTGHSQSEAAPSTQAVPRQLLESPAGEKPREPKLTAREAGRIARATGSVLREGHYRQVPLDDAISRTFFTNYLSTLDYGRLVFTQQDIEEFGRRYATRLDDLTIAADASPAYEIFQRYLERLAERTSYAVKLLEEPLDFTVEERFNPKRNEEPWPANEEEANELWRKRVKYDVLQSRLGGENPDEITGKLTKRYTRLLNMMRTYDEEEILSLYLTALSHAYDPHSDYMSPSEARQFEINNVKLSLSGIGALLEWDDGYTRIKSLVPGGPAERSKQLKPKDRIVAVSQGDEEPVDVVEVRLNKVVELIRGKKGSEVRLTIIPADSEDGTTRVVRLIRDDIPLAEQFAKARIVDLPTDDGRTVHLGIVVLPQFYENCARDVEKLIRRLNEERVAGIVLDLRRNGGGILEEAIEVAGLFIEQGPIVQVKAQNGVTRVLEDENPKVAWSGPLAVLVGHLSASASEIVAAALQDYDRALIIGDSATHGKGTVQTLVPLAQFFGWRGFGTDAGKLKFTVSKFYRIAGGTTQKYGVTPDISLPSVLDHMELGESHLPNCLPADRTTPLTFERLGRVEPYLAALREKSANRVASSREFAYIMEDIEEIKRRQADPSVSLNEQTRISEKEEREARDKAREEERKALKTAGIPILELTLEAVDKGQPPKLLRPTEKDAEEDEEASALGLADEDESRLEPHVREALEIMADYLDLLEASGQQWAMEHRARAAAR